MAEVKVPELAESIAEGTIAKWLKKLGEAVEKGEYLVELETDKVNVEIMSDFSGILKELKFEEGDTVKIGDIIAVIDETGKAEAVTSPEESIKADSGRVTLNDYPESDQPHIPIKEPQEGAGKRAIASPAARKLAREKGINLQDVPASDPLGRIRKQDVSSLRMENEVKRPTEHGDRLVPEKRQTPEQDPNKPVMIERMSRRRQTIAKRLVEVQQTAAMLTTFNEIDMTAVMDLRKRRKDKFFEEHDVRLGFMSFFTKAVVASLKKFPYLNAEVQGDSLLVKKYYDIGIAVAAEEGLVVPVVREAERKSFAEIETDIFNLAEKARNNKLAIKDLQGGTFTITNGGVFGSLLSTPILNGPQVGILGMHKIQLRPVAIDKEKTENRPMMYVALSYDHRIVDGKEAVQFLSKIKEMLEDPETLLLEG